MSKQLQEAYESMPQEAKDDFWRHLEEALKWRDSKGIKEIPEKYLKDVAEVFWNHAGMDIGVYT